MSDSKAGRTTIGTGGGRPEGTGERAGRAATACTAPRAAAVPRRKRIVTVGARPGRQRELLRRILGSKRRQRAGAEQMKRRMDTRAICSSKARLRTASNSLSREPQPLRGRDERGAKSAPLEAKRARLAPEKAGEACSSRSGSVEETHAIYGSADAMRADRDCWTRTRSRLPSSSLVSRARRAEQA